jgi:ABC-type transport system involved in multi-copper enzyme maturation permease subunit
MQQIFAMAWLTWKAAFRFRLFLVIAGLLLLSVIGLPLLVKDDGTARGFTQILLTYTLGIISTLLGISTLWLACGTLARDIEECQIQVVATKPIARWQIWLGKWLGIVSLNALLLAISGGAVYGMLQWRADRLPLAEQKVLRNEVLVARASVKPPDHHAEIEEQTDALLKERLEKFPLDRDSIAQVRQQIREQIKASKQIVPPGYSREWTLDLGMARFSLRDQPLFLRIKFNAAQKPPSGTIDGFWQVGLPEGNRRPWFSGPLSLAPDSFHEFRIPPNLFDSQGKLTVSFLNVPENPTVLFPLEDGIEVLYRQGGFGFNYIRGLGIILCWMALLAALGLAAASFLSFPVAAFFSLGLLTLVLASGTMANAVSEGTIANWNAEKGTKGWSPADIVVIPTFKGILRVISLAKDFSPVDSLSSGRSITWTELGLAFAQIVLLLSGGLAVFGMVVLTRRELATAQGTQ